MFTDFNPEEVPLNIDKEPLTPEDLEYIQKTDELKAYLRRKHIHAKIFSQPSPKPKIKASNKLRANNNSLQDVVPGVTTDDEGKPIQI